LHIGNIDPTSSSKDALTPAFWANCRHLDGMLGHSYRSLVHLEAVFAQLKQTEDALLIVTGDLTAFGSEIQFETAAEYLGSTLKPPKGRHIGLREKTWRNLAIPGNHDHWPGKRVILGAPTGGLSTYFPDLPAEYLFRLSSGHLMRFLRLDSDVDVSPLGSKRFLARGCFSSHLETLANQLPDPQEKEIRVLLLHHSFSKTGLILSMTGRSRKALSEFIVNHAISVLLCGHIHEPPLVDTHGVEHLLQKRDFLEGRSGTTSQISTLLLDWKDFRGKRPERPNHWPNSFLVHRLCKETDDSIDWHTETYLETPEGFKPASLALGKSFPKMSKIFRVYQSPLSRMRSK